MADSMIEVLAAVPDEDTPGLWIEFYTTKDRDRIMALLKPAKDDPAQWPSPKFQAELDAGVAIAEALNLPAATEAPAPRRLCAGEQRHRPLLLQMQHPPRCGRL